MEQIFTKFCHIFTLEKFSRKHTLQKFFFQLLTIIFGKVNEKKELRDKNFNNLPENECKRRNPIKKVIR